MIMIIICKDDEDETLVAYNIVISNVKACILI